MDITTLPDWAKDITTEPPSREEFIAVANRWRLRSDEWLPEVYIGNVRAHEVDSRIECSIHGGEGTAYDDWFSWGGKRWTVCRDTKGDPIPQDGTPDVKPEPKPKARPLKVESETYQFAFGCVETDPNDNNISHEHFEEMTLTEAEAHIAQQRAYLNELAAMCRFAREKGVE